MTPPESSLDALPPGILEQLTAADTALHNGDARQRQRLWSHGAPVTLFGAVETSLGWEAVRQTFDWLASRFSDCGSFRYEVLAAETSGDLAYVVGIEHTTASIGGAPPAPYKLRVTTILRREAGAWKVVHRHGSPYDGGSKDTVWRLKDPPA